MLKLTVANLAQRATVSPNTVVRAEADKPVNPATLAVLRSALEAAGVEFTDDGGVRPNKKAAAEAADAQLKETPA